jgi:hypothetical protein
VARSRDGFGARDFHSRCDWHANTLTVILDTNGRSGKEDNFYKADPSLKSFLFTLKNPHNFPARRFALKAEKKEVAIYCWSDCGPHFCHVCVKNNCNAHTGSRTSEFGVSYVNNTGLAGCPFFTDSRGFQVQEIEVFEIIL